MITREEAKQKLCMNLLSSEASGISWVADDFVIELIDQLFYQQDQLEQHIKSLEAQLANTEHLTCVGCKYNHFGSGSDGIAVDCTLSGYGCKRSMLDRYELKGTQ